VNVIVSDRWVAQPRKDIRNMTNTHRHLFQPDKSAVTEHSNKSGHCINFMDNTLLA